MLGQAQNYARKHYGSNSNESLFYVHALSLPLFALMGGDLATHSALWSQSPPSADLLPLPTSLQQLPGVAFILLPLAQLPIMWMIVLANVISQYVWLVASCRHSLAYTRRHPSTRYICPCAERCECTTDIVCV